MNKFLGVGRLTDEPSPKSSGVFFTLAIHESKEYTTQIDCSAWGKVAIYMQKYLHKGDLISIEGRINTYNKEYEVVEHTADGKSVSKKINAKRQIVQVTEVKALAYNKKNKDNAKDITSEPVTSDNNAKSIEEFI